MRSTNATAVTSSVQVLRESPSSLLLTIRDDGIGFDANASAPEAGLGRSLIEAFVRQLRGELELRVEDGTVVQVRFPAVLKDPQKKVGAGHHPPLSVLSDPTPSTKVSSSDVT